MEQYFKFDGSATRSEFWAVAIVGWVCAMIVGLFGAIFAFGEFGVFAAIVGGAVLVATFISYLWLTVATTMRRCRNAGINTWWTLASFIPYIGWIVFIVLGCLKTDEGTN